MAEMWNLALQSRPDRCVNNFRAEWGQRCARKLYAWRPQPWVCNFWIHDVSTDMCLVSLKGRVAFSLGEVSDFLKNKLHGCFT